MASPKRTLLKKNTPATAYRSSIRKSNVPMFTNWGRAPINVLKILLSCLNRFIILKIRAILKVRITVVMAPIFSLRTRSANSPSHAATTITKSNLFQPS